MVIKTALPQIDDLAAAVSSSTSLETAGITLGFVALSLAFYFFTFIKKTLPFPELQLSESDTVRKTYGTAPSSLRWSRLLKDAGDKFSKPFVVNFPDFGRTIILPPKYTEDVKNNKDMSLDQTSKKDFFPNYPGFEAMRAGTMGHTFHDAVRIKLTQALTFFTDDLSDEANQALPELYPVKDDWQTTLLQPGILSLVTRLSSLIFLGRDFNHLKEWQEMSGSYTMNLFQAARELRLWNPWLQPIVHWFLPQCRTLRAQVKQARKIIEPEVNIRRQRRQEAIKNGTQPKKSLDSVDWFEDTKQGHFDFVAGELLLSVVAIHTTTATLTNVLLDICAHRDIIEPLREEIRNVLKEDGSLQRTTLHKLRLMDSVLKESQRLHPLGQATLKRRVMADVKLHDGTILPEGSYTVTGPLLNFDADTFENPYEFDGYRFLKMRQQPGQENKWSFVTTTPEHMGFGHGVHACPGRFFASNELKIALMHMLMKYDWKLPDGESRPESMELSLETPPNPRARLMYKARASEVQL